MNYDDEISVLKEQIRALQAQNRAPITPRTGSMPLIRAKSFADLQMQARGVLPPCMGFVHRDMREEKHLKYVHDPNANPPIDPHNEPPDKPEFKFEEYECARYFILTYPPKPPVFRFFQNIIKGEKTKEVDYETMGIYQPSAGILGSIIEVQKVPYDENLFAVGTALNDPVPPKNNSDPVWQINGVTTIPDDSDPSKPDAKIVTGIQLGYVNVDMSKPMWLEIKSFGPFGQALDDYYSTILTALVKADKPTAVTISENQLKWYGTHFTAAAQLPDLDITPPEIPE